MFRKSKSGRRKRRIRIKPVDTEFATTKHALNRIRGLQWVDDPERGPENKTRQKSRPNRES